MRLFLDPDLLNKGPRPSARAPKAASTPKSAAASASGSKIADIGTGEKPGAVAPSAPTANVAKRPSARAGRAAAPKSEGAQGATPAVKAPKQSKSGAGKPVQTIACPLGEQLCVSYGGTGKHRPDSPMFQKHSEQAAKRGAKSGAAKPQTPVEQQTSLPTEEAATSADPKVEAKQEKKKAKAVKLGEDKTLHGAAAESVSDVPDVLDERPQKEIPQEKAASSKAPAGKAKRAKVAPDPEMQKLHAQHMQEYLSGSRDQEHHQLIHAMTVAEHRRAAAEFRTSGASDLAQLHEQAALSKPRLKDVSSSKVHESIPEGDRPFSAPYLDGYIGHASRYLAGGPGGHPNSKFSQIHAMTESDHNSLAAKLEAAGANSAATRHRRIAALKKDFDTREKQMLEHKEAQKTAAAEAKVKKDSEKKSKKSAVANNPFNPGQSAASEGPKSHADDVREVGSNALSHLIHNHDMPPEHKRDLLQRVLHLQDLSDRADAPGDGDAAALAQLKQDLGHYGSSGHTGRKGMPGKRYLHRFESHELDAQADLAEMAGEHNLAARYREASSSKRESVNREKIKTQQKADQAKAKADAKAAKDKAKAAAAQAKAQAKAQKEADSKERKRLATAPHLPGDHDEYLKHAQGSAGRIRDFLDSPVDLEPHVREKVENAHAIVEAHGKLQSLATPEQRRELDDALKVAQTHMDKTKFHQLPDKEDPQNEQYRINARGLHSAFSKWWGTGSSVSQAVATDQTSGQLARQLPQMAGQAAVDASAKVLTSTNQDKQKPEADDSGVSHSDDSFADRNPGSSVHPSSKKESNVKKGLYLDLDLIKAVQIPNIGIDSDESKMKDADTATSGGGSGYTPDKPNVGANWHPDEEEEETNKSILYEVQDLLRSMSENLAAQLRPETNSPVEAAFLETQGFSPAEAKYNTSLLHKSFLRKKYDSWLLNRMEKSLSSLWGKQ